MFEEDKFKNHFNDLGPLLESSQGKDIVVVLGNTGAGKSTLMNFLSNKDMFLNKDDDIELRNPNDPQSMRIGMGANSETLMPRQIEVGQLIFYDLPGFNDNRGTTTNLINAASIKSLIEKAKSVRIIFVCKHAEIEAGRGDFVQKLLETSNRLIPESSAIKNSSMLVITKSQKTNTQDLVEFLKIKIDVSSTMKNWFDTNRIAPMSKGVEDQQRQDILRKINLVPSSKINLVNIEAIYSRDLTEVLKEIFRNEMDKSLDKVFNSYPMNQQTVPIIDKSISYFQNSFRKDFELDLETSVFIKLLKPLSNQTFVKQAESFQTIVNQKQDQRVNELVIAKQELVRVEDKIKTDGIQSKLEQENLIQENKVKKANKIIVKKEEDIKIQTNLKLQAHVVIGEKEVVVQRQIQEKIQMGQEIFEYKSQIKRQEEESKQSQSQISQISQQLQTQKETADQLEQQRIKEKKELKSLKAIKEITQSISNMFNQNRWTLPLFSQPD